MTSTEATRRASAHTPEPWRYVDELAPGYAEIGLRKYVIETPNGEFDIASLIFNEADARRICAAVNACQGISTEALESGVVKELLISSFNFRETLSENSGNAQLCLAEHDAWRDAIEKAMAP